MRLLVLFFFLLASATAFGQEVVDSVVSIRRSKFFTDLQKREAGISCLQGVGSDVYVNFKSPFLKGLSTEYLVTSKGLVLHFGRSGKLYRSGPIFFIARVVFTNWGAMVFGNRMGCFGNTLT
ncbi:MAG: hypothetical protein EBT80_03540 [Chitinophagales bacterium]|nr:hypothetical protein [Chitinophagales bacterium]